MMALTPEQQQALIQNDRSLGLPDGFTLSQFTQESSLNPNAVSSAGARGWAQILPSTQATLEKRFGRKLDPTDFNDAVDMHHALMAENLTHFGNPADALRAYHGGWDQKNWGPQTEAYFNKVVANIGPTVSDSAPRSTTYRNGMQPASFNPAGNYQDPEIFVDTPNAAPRQASGGAPRAQGGYADPDIFVDQPGKSERAAKMIAPERKKPNPDDFLPTDGLVGSLPTSVKAGLVSAGHETTKLWQGLKSGFYQLSGDQVSLDKLRQEQARDDQLFNNLADKHPVAATAGAVLPYLAVPAGSFASMPAAALRGVAPRVATTLGRSALADGALQGAFFGQLRQGDETGWGTGALGGAAGAMVGKAIGKLISPAIGDQLGQQQQKVVQSAEALGARMTPGQRLNSPTLQRVEAGLESNPVTSGAFSGLRQNNQQVLNQAAAKAIGESANSLDAGVLANAEQRIGGIYNLVRGKATVGLDNLAEPLSGIMDEAHSMTIRPGALDSDPLFAKAMDFVTGGGATQAELSSLASQLGKRAKTMMTSQQGDRELGSALFKTKDLIDDALMGSLQGSTKKAFQDARAQYRSLMQLYGSGVVNEQTGNVSGRMLANTLARSDRKGFRLGGNDSDMYNMARFSRAFPSIVGDSGTATRLALPLLSGTLGGIAGYGAGDGEDAATNAAKYAALGLGAPMLATKAYLSPALSAYLGNRALAEGPASEILKRLALGSAVASPAVSARPVTGQ
jgi:hypothetical protein